VTAGSAYAHEVKRLRGWNAVLALAHLLQGIAILALANDTTIPITWSFIDGPPATGDVSTSTLYDLPFGAAVAAFLFLAALDHGLMAAPRVHPWYERNLEAEMNPARWWEYSLSASLMVVLIAMLTGIRDVTALIALFGVNAAMILFGLVMERVNRPGEPVDWRPFLYGSVVGVFPWLAIAVQLGHAESEADVPAFVIAIFVTLFVLFFSFAVNMALQYLRVGPWRSYLFGERSYLVLSLVAKSALAWQVFAGALAG
jgi:heliorhodopsin